MKGLNQVVLMGNLGRDPEMRFTPAGKPVTDFSLATSRKYRKEDGGDLIEETEWHYIVTWNKLAETCNQSLSKGSAVAVTGRIHYQKWEDDGGNKHSQTVIIAGDVIFLDKPTGGKREDEIPDEKLDDIPF